MHAYNPSYDPILTALSLPTPSIERFKGDIEQYRVFIAAFDAQVGFKTLSDHDKLDFLNQFLEGTPKELIAGCFHDAFNGYREARKILEAEYGHPYKPAMSLVKRIESWQEVKADDPQGLKKLACFMKKSYTSLNGISQTHMLDHPTTMLKVFERLPRHL
jgi:hypothetical protein